MDNFKVFSNEKEYTEPTKPNNKNMKDLGKKLSIWH